jgi:hypothetical protein
MAISTIIKASQQILILLSGWRTYNFLSNQSLKKKKITSIESVFWSSFAIRRTSGGSLG